jgi:hypothetical protein
MASVPHGADANAKWVAAVTAPDLCIVGGKPTPFDTAAILSAWDPANPETRVRALTHPVYRVEDRILGVLGNAGSGQVSGVSLGTGHVVMRAPSPPTRVIARNREVVVDRTPAQINTDASGAGGTPGYIYTELASATKLVGDVGDAADLGLQSAEKLMSRGAARGADGRFMSRASWEQLPVRDRIQAATSVPNPGRANAARALRGVARPLGPAGQVLAGAEGVSQQLANDATRTDLTDGQRYGRAATRGGAKVGGGLVGAWAGAKAGAAAGVWFGPWGAAIGGVIGGIAGGVLGDMAGDNVADAVLDQPFAGGGGGR